MSCRRLKLIITVNNAVRYDSIVTYTDCERIFVKTERQILYIMCEEMYDIWQ